MKRIWLWGLAGVAIVLGGVVSYILFFPGTQPATNNNAMEDYISKMSTKPKPSPSYITFAGQARTLGEDMNRLQQQTVQGKWTEVSKTLDVVQEDYRRVWDLTPQLESESSLDTISKGFLVAADNALKTQVTEIGRRLLSDEAKLSTEQQNMEQAKAQIEAELAQLRRQTPATQQETTGGIKPLSGTVYFNNQAQLWMAIAFVSGFALLIPWYKKFADEAQYYSYSLAGTARWTPTHILGIAIGANAALIFAYLLWKGYIAL